MEQSDFAAWQPLWDGYNAFYGREGETALPSEITRVTWQRFFDPSEPVFALVVAFGAGALVPSAVLIAATVGYGALGAALGVGTLRIARRSPRYALEAPLETQVEKLPTPSDYRR